MGGGGEGGQERGEGVGERLLGEWSVAHPHAVEEPGVDFQIVEGGEGARGGEIGAQGEEGGIAGFFVWGVLGWLWNLKWREAGREMQHTICS